MHRQTGAFEHLPPLPKFAGTLMEITIPASSYYIMASKEQDMFAMDLLSNARAPDIYIKGYMHCSYRAQ